VKVRGRLLLAVGGTAVISASAMAATPGVAPDNAGATTIGAPLAQAEVDQARLFCLSAMGAAKASVDPDLTCDCFQLQWEKRSDQVERLALAISLAPNSPQARAAVWTIGQLQGGLHEAKLETLSGAFRAAARQAMASCSH
jgi:hypothetical protein